MHMERDTEHRALQQCGWTKVNGNNHQGLVRPAEVHCKHTGGEESYKVILRDFLGQKSWELKIELGDRVLAQHAQGLGYSGTHESHSEAEVLNLWAMTPPDPDIYTTVSNSSKMTVMT